MNTKPLYTLAALVLASLGGCAHALAQFVPPRILKHPNQIQTTRLDILNSPYKEANMGITPDGKYLFFLSARGGQSWSQVVPRGAKIEFDGDIWFSRRVGGQWTAPQCLGSNVNTWSGEDEPNISPDGQTVSFQSWREGRTSTWRETGGPYYQSTLSGAVWGIAQGLGGGINAFFVDKERSFNQTNRIYEENDYATDGATISADGKIFIVAVGKYSGKMDLYISRKNAYGQWSYLKRLPISTLGNERTPFLAGDGRTLYFASDGYGGYGGLDIFKTTLNDNDTCGEVVNIGAPFNSWLSDCGLIITASGDDAYFIREDDIYYANTKNALPEMKPDGSTLQISGIITSSKTKRGVSATIKIINPANGSLIAQTQSNGITGEYTLILPNSLKTFTQEVSKTGFEKSTKQHTSPVLQKGINQIMADLEIKPIENTPPVVKTTPPPKPQDRECQAETGRRE